ncbi:lytic polysaccharide monooxygenase [Streptomyces sp. LaPpAH-108]|uniref:lytic polysaccharide monooxygenase n=1 Tax=Streptomyces sp. LaPpAH-108 TaxID=1155714 RepID=UPI000361C543|nr:lytic polysaccharide monooxygenase [Streptomyces sp. LaPpAH-108]
MPFPTPSAHPGPGMSRLRVAAAVAVLGLTPLTLAAAPASAHGSGHDSGRGSTSGSGSWGADLCGTRNGEFGGLDLVGTDWPTPRVHSGPYTFTYRVTTHHQGRLKVYVTTSGYDPARPLTWSALDLAHPVAWTADATPSDGVYTVTGTLPERTGRQVLYAVWHRADGSQVFRSCADVDFGGTTPPPSPAPTPHQAAPVPTLPAPTPVASKEIRVAAEAVTPTAGRRERHERKAPDRATTPSPTTNSPVTTVTSPYLADTGAAPHTSYGAVVGAGVLALGSAALFLSVRQRSTGRERGGR